MANRKHDPAPCWQPHLMRGRKAERLGEAPDAETAVERAMMEWHLQAWQRRRVLVWRED